MHVNDNREMKVFHTKGQDGGRGKLTFYLSHDRGQIFSFYPGDLVSIEVKPRFAENAFSKHIVNKRE